MYTPLSTIARRSSYFSYVISFIFFLLGPFFLRADDQKFELTGLVTDNNLPLADVRISVYEESVFMTQFSTTVNGKFNFPLEYNRSFKIRLEKDNYAAEDIVVNTILPKEAAEQKRTFKVALNMFQVSSSMPFVFNEPVAAVFFHQVVNDFTCDVNYKKTFQPGVTKVLTVHEKLGNSGISEEFKFELTLHRKKAVQAAKDTVAQKTEEVTPVKFSEDKSAFPFVASITPYEAKKERIQLINNDKVCNSVTLVENTRRINKLNVELNGEKVEYTQIKYLHGGVYYFKNNLSISLETFTREIKNKHLGFCGDVK
jgi:hypothetical protein